MFASAARPRRAMARGWSRTAAARGGRTWRLLPFQKARRGPSASFFWKAGLTPCRPREELGIPHRRGTIRPMGTDTALTPLAAAAPAVSPAPGKPAYRYAAFISYRHAPADRKW